MGTKLFFCYLVAGAAYIFYLQWPHLEGHAHIPFSGFPAFLVMAPLAPYLMVADLMELRGNPILGPLVFVLSFGAAFLVLFKWRKPKT
jgi:hypothetical protein